MKINGNQQNKNTKLAGNCFNHTLATLFFFKKNCTVVPFILNKHKQRT